MANNGVPVPIFQSTLSMRRATPVRSTAIGRTDFNPRSP